MAKTTKQTTYQDVWRDGELIERGERECEARYLAIKPLLDKYEREFTVLDIGAAQGYFAFRIVEDYPEAIVVCIEQDDALLGLIEQSNATLSSRIIFLNHKLTANDLIRLSECEHFDVVLALNVLHHFERTTDDIAGRLLNVVRSLGDTILFETPTHEDKNALGELSGNEMIEPLLLHVGGVGDECLGEFDSHVTADVKRPLWLLGSFDARLIAPYFDAKSWCDIRIATSKSQSVVISTKSAGSYDTREWIAGINLRTYQKLNGVWPTRGSVVSFVGREQINCRHQHGDVRPWNFILTGTSTRLIDGGESDERAVYDDAESFDVVCDDLSRAVGDQRSIDSWLKVGARQLCIVTPMRNARPYVERYFEQIVQLRKTLRMAVRLIVAEGDSTDDTATLVNDLALEHNIALDLFDTSPITKGRGPWGSVEDPVRLKCMSEIMNAALSRVSVENDTAVLWLMCDVEYDSQTIADMMTAYDNDSKVIVAGFPLVGDSDRFWDTWAFRGLDGVRFQNSPPYHPDVSRSRAIELSSAGTCLVMSPHVARSCKASSLEAVSFCNDARGKGIEVFTDTDFIIRHKPAPRKRLLYIGDILAPTAYARITHALLPELHALNFDIDVVGINFHGGPDSKGLVYNIWPAGANGQFVVLEKLLRTRPHYDAMVVLGDVWDAVSVMRVIDRVSNHTAVKPDKCIAYLTVDSENHRGAEHLRRYDSLVSCTEFGANELREIVQAANIDINVIPFGVDRTFSPTSEARAKITSSIGFVTPDTFILGAVAKNQYRKRLDLTIEVFAEFLAHTNADAVLLIHTMNANMSNGPIDLGRVAHYYGVADRVLVHSDPFDIRTLSNFYNSLDAFISTSIGEGFCLPVLEAMACGTPCFVPNHTGFDWAEPAIKVPCDSNIPCGPLDQPTYTMGKVVNVNAFVELLTQYYDNDLKHELTADGVALAKSLTWLRCAKSFARIVQDLFAVHTLRKVA